MKKCAECGYSNQIDTGYCVVCGSSMETLQSIKRSRFLFFVTPFFIIAILCAFLTELGSVEPISSSIRLGGDFALIYLSVGLCFWICMRAFKIKVNLASSWLAGVFTVVHLLACSLLINLFTNNSSITSLGDETYTGLKWLGIIFLPILFTGLLSIAVKSKIEHSPIHIPVSKWSMFFIKNLIVIILLLIGLSISVVYFSQPSDKRALLKVKLLFDLQAYKRAIGLINDNIVESKHTADFYYLKGEILLRLPSLKNNADTALDCMKQASILEPNNAGFKLKLGIVHDIEDNRAEAIAALKEAAEIASSSAIIWQVLGGLQTKYDNNEEAIKSFKHALKLKPNDPLLMNNLAFTLLEINRDLPLALELAKESVKKMPNALFNLDTLAWAYYKNDNANKALEIMNVMHSVNIELTSEIEFHYAVILNKLNLLKKPVEALNKLLQKTDVLTNIKLKKEITGVLHSIQSEQVK